MYFFDEIFIKLVNLSVSASWLILALILFRLVFKKAPGWLNCCLWALVAIRLVCPFSVESALSLVPSSEFISEEGFYYSAAPSVHSGIAMFNSTVNPMISEALAPDISASVNPAQILGFISGVVWLVGFSVMLFYAFISYTKLRKKVSAAILLKENQWICDEVKSPFILGFLRPKIYLPSDMLQENLSCVTAHEKAHLKRKDHLWKPIGFLLLSVYWFNPLMWLSYILLCRDIELACDEKVIKKMKADQKKAYSEALLSCCVSQKMITVCPVAFGEVGVKQRIKSVLNYKKPAFWIVLVAVVVSGFIAVCFMTDPKSQNGGKKEISVYEIDEFGFPMYDIIMGGETLTVIKDAYTYFDTFFGNGIGEVRELLQTVSLRKLSAETVDHSVEIQYNAIIKIDDTVTVHFHDGYSKLYLQKGNSHYSIRSDDYAVLNVGKVKEFFENEEYKNQGVLWTTSPFKSTIGLCLYLDEGYEINGEIKTTNGGSATEYNSDTRGLKGVLWTPGADGDQAKIIIPAVKDGEKQSFEVILTKVGADEKEMITYFLLSAEDTVIGSYNNSYEYVLGKAEIVEADPDSEASAVYWSYNPYAGGTWWYITQYILPEGYEIKSAEATSGTATVEDRFYNDPDGGKCVKWSPGFYENEAEASETDIVIRALKGTTEAEFRLKVTEVYDDSNKSDIALRTYKVTPVNCKMKEETAGTYYLEEK